MIYLIIQGLITGNQVARQAGGQAGVWADMQAHIHLGQVVHHAAVRYQLALIALLMTPHKVRPCVEVCACACV